MWEWLGEPLAIDVANTRKRRGMLSVDLLTDGPALLSWISAERAIKPERVPEISPRLAAARLAEVRALRDDVAALLAGAVAGRLPAPSRRRINRLAARLPVVAELRPGGGLRLRVAGAGDPVDELLGRLAAAAVASAAEPDRLAFCDAPSCGQFFTRPRPDARWCSPACGTRFRVARHAARHRSGTRG